MEGRASRVELISAGVIIDLTPGPKGDVWSLDVDYPVGVTRGVWDIIQRAVTTQGASDKPGSVIKDMIYMADLCIKLTPDMARTILPGARDDQMRAQLGELYRLHPGDWFFPCYIPTFPVAGDIKEAICRDTVILRAILTSVEGGRDAMTIMTLNEG